MNSSFTKEATIGFVTATIAIPLLWLLAAAISPHRSIDSIGVELVVMVIVGAGLVMLLRSIWGSQDQYPGGTGRNWTSLGDSIPNRTREPERVS